MCHRASGPTTASGLRDIAQAVVAAHFEADRLQGAVRIAFMERRLKEIEAAA